MDQRLESAEIRAAVKIRIIEETTEAIQPGGHDMLIQCWFYGPASETLAQH